MPDGFPSNVLKSCSAELYGVTGFIPLCWKSSFLVPLRRYRKRGLVESYEGSGKLSAVTHLFEQTIYHHIISLYHHILKYAGVVFELFFPLSFNPILVSFDLVYTIQLHDAY